VEVTGDAQPVDAPRDDGSVQRIHRCRRARVAADYDSKTVWSAASLERMAAVRAARRT
jgi:hypothetical protein